MLTQMLSRSRHGRLRRTMGPPGRGGPVLMPPLVPSRHKATLHEDKRARYLAGSTAGPAARWLRNAGLGERGRGVTDTEERCFHGNKRVFSQPANHRPIGGRRDGQR